MKDNNLDENHSSYLYMFHTCCKCITFVCKNYEPLKNELQYFLIKSSNAKFVMSKWFPVLNSILLILWSWKELRFFLKGTNFFKVKKKWYNKFQLLFFIFFNFVVLFKWQSSISIFSQVWICWKCESRKS